MAHDVFISYTQQDKQTADAVCASLESHRIRCWISPRDVMPGTEYGEDVIRGIEHCRIFVVVFSAGANQSPHVRREVERAVSKGKIILPFRIEDVLPSKAMEYCLSNTHWLDAMTPPVEAHLAHLTEIVRRLLEDEDPLARTTPSASSTMTAAPPPRQGHEYKSRMTIGGLPLVHFAMGLPHVDGRPPQTKGIIAIGDRPIGVIAIGQSVSIGVIAIGRVGIGVIPIAFLSIGLFSIGAFAIGAVASWGVISSSLIGIGFIGAGYHSHGPFMLSIWKHLHQGETDEVFEPWVGVLLHVVLTTICFLTFIVGDRIELIGRFLLRSGHRQ